MQTEKHDQSQVEEAILGIISSIDKPSSPAGEVIQTFHAELYGRKQEVLKIFRDRVREVSLDDLRRVANKYLIEENSNIAVVSNKQSSSIAGNLNLSLMDL